jgi:CheY-like chemotaxis protein
MIEAMRILAVEDERQSIYSALVEWRLRGYDVTRVTNLLDARAVLSKSKFDLVVADVRLPPTDDETKIDQFGGVDLIRDLRAGRVGRMNKKTPFMIVTAQIGSLSHTAIKAFGDCIGIFDKLQLEAIEDAVNNFVELSILSRARKPRGR